MGDYPTSWLPLDAAAALLGVKPRMAGVIAHRDKWRRVKNTEGRYVYALTDIRTTERNRRNALPTRKATP